MTTSPSRYRFGEFELDPGAARLWRSGAVVEIADLQFRLLELLVSRPGQIWERAQLQDALWGAETHLEADNSLNAAVSRLRDVLEDEATAPRYVETVPRRGYRFVAPVEVLSATAPSAAPRTPTSLARRAPILLAVAFVLGAVAVWLATRFVSRAPAVSSASQAPAPSGEVATHLERGREFMSRGSHKGLERAIASFVQALAIDPGSSEAWAEMSLAYLGMAEYDYWRPRDAYPAARLALERARAGDPNSGAVFLAMTSLLAHDEWRVQDALEATEQALRDPSTAGAAGELRAQLLSCVGRHEEALEQMQAVVAQDPGSAPLNARYAWLLFRAERFDEAAEQARETIALAPEHVDAYDNLKWILLTAGRHTEAVDVWETMIELVEGEGRGFRESVAQLGLEGVFRRSVEQRLERAAEPGYHSPFDLALELAFLGERDEALDWLERALVEKETDVVSMAVDPRIADLRDEPRFQELLRQLGLR